MTMNRDEGRPRPAVLRRELGLREAVSIGIGGTVGGGIFVLVGVAGGKAGPAALLAFGLAFIASLVIALPYAELACRIPMAGGGYAFAQQILGEPWGFFMGWIYWGAYVFLSGYVTLGFGDYLHAVTGIPVTAGAAALVALCVAVNLMGVKVSGTTQTVVILTAIVGLAGFAVWGVPHVSLANFTPFAPFGVGGVLSAALVTFLSFGGFDMVAAAGEEIKHPERNLPRAILLTLVGVLGLYIAVAFVVIGTIPLHILRTSGSPLADAAGIFGGPVARGLVVFCALLTTAATANAIMVVTSRTVFAMARDRLLPRRFAHLDPRSGAPWPAVVVNGVLMALVAVVGTVAVSSSTGGFLYVLHFVPPLVALVVLRRRQSEGERPSFQAPLPKVLVPIAFVGVAGLVAASGPVGVSVGSSWLVVGLAAYALYRRNRAGLAVPGRGLDPTVTARSRSDDGER